MLDAAVGGAEMLGQKAGLLAIAREQVPRQMEELFISRVGGDARAHGRQLEQNRADGGPPVGQPHGAIRPESDGTLQLHPPSPRARSYGVSFPTWSRALHPSMRPDADGRTVRTLKETGVSFEHYDLPDMTRRGDVHVSGEMKAAWFKDPDGNILAVVSR